MVAQLHCIALRVKVPGAWPHEFFALSILNHSMIVCIPEMTQLILPTNVNAPYRAFPTVVIAPRTSPSERTADFASPFYLIVMLCSLSAIPGGGNCQSMISASV